MLTLKKSDFPNIKMLQDLDDNVLEEFVKKVEKEDKIITKYGFIYMFFRKPELPAITITENKLLPAYSLKELTKHLLLAKPFTTDDLITVIDNNGDEFHFETYRDILRPDWFKKRWRKKEIIELYDKNCKNPANHFIPAKKLNYIKVKELIFNICGLISMH